MIIVLVRCSKLQIPASVAINHNALDFDRKTELHSPFLVKILLGKCVRYDAFKKRYSIRNVYVIALYKSTLTYLLTYKTGSLAFAGRMFRFSGGPEFSQWHYGSGKLDSASSAKSLIFDTTKYFRCCWPGFGGGFYAFLYKTAVKIF